ncbi:hypothetical protein YB2330_004105 [Saitoella coloradoensis]
MSRLKSEADSAYKQVQWPDGAFELINLFNSEKIKWHGESKRLYLLLGLINFSVEEIASCYFPGKSGNAVRKFWERSRANLGGDWTSEKQKVLFQTFAEKEGDLWKSIAKETDGMGWKKCRRKILENGTELAKGRKFYSILICNLGPPSLRESYPYIIFPGSMHVAAH